MGARPCWTDEEKRLVIENPELSVAVLAEKLGRTKIAVYNFRHRIIYGSGYGKRVKLGQEFDTRPSGWYRETIGTMLMEHEDAWQAWLHFHRYVEVKMESNDERGWTTLMCRRDADAP